LSGHGALGWRFLLDPAPTFWGVTFAEGVLRLVRAGARTEKARDSDGLGAAEATPVAGEDYFAVVPAGEEDPGSVAAALAAPGPGFADIEAAVTLVSSGLANRIVLTGFPSWPGLLWQAYQLADASGVVILPAVVRPGGRVDVVIERDAASHG
jgi:hypothetical protein